MEPKLSLSCSQEPSNGPRLEPDDPGHATCSYFSKIDFNITLQSTCSILSRLFPSRFPNRILYEKVEKGIWHEN
jgi:hypothetical protein